MKILFVSPHPPLPLDSGTRLRTFHLLDELSKRAEVGLVCLDRQPGTRTDPCPAEAIELALPALRGVRTVPAPAARKRLRQLSSLVRGGSYTVRMHAAPALVSAARAAAQGFEPDVVHCESLAGAYVHPTAPAAASVWVLSMPRRESLLRERLADTADEWLRRTLYRHEAAALAALERRHLSEFDACLAVSEDERAAFAEQGADAITVPNGVEPLPDPDPPEGPARDEPLRVLVVGSLDDEPNRHGLEWFAAEVAPPARARLAIDVVAVGPGRRGPELPGVRYLGRLDDLGPAYREAHAAVVPLRAGAGTHLKALEAMARGVPLVSTSLGVEGLALTDGVHALIADEPAAMVERLALLDASLRGNRHFAARLTDAGYEFASEHFWPRIGERLAAAYEEWAEQSASTAPHSP